MKDSTERVSMEDIKNNLNNLEKVFLESIKINKTLVRRLEEMEGKYYQHMNLFHREDLNISWNISVKRIAQAIDLSPRRVHQKADKENWAYIMGKARGGQQRYYKFESLPLYIQVKIMGEHYAKK